MAYRFDEEEMRREKLKMKKGFSLKKGTRFRKTVLKVQRGHKDSDVS